jgi:hypothetical protein
MADDPKMNSVIDAAVHEKLAELLGWEASMAEPYIVPLRQSVMAAIIRAGYTWNPPKPKGGK